MDEKDLIKIGLVVAKATAVTLVYALPALLATWWRQRNPERIAVLNLLLGWTGIGWLALLSHVLWRRWSGRRHRPSRRARAGAGRRSEPSTAPLSLGRDFQDPAPLR